MRSRSLYVAHASSLLLSSLAVPFVTARLPLHSSYADKCIYYPDTGHRYHDKYGPIGSSHQAVFFCGAYPTEADFTPLPGAETADECGLACTGDCEGSTWSEVAGTEVRCHAYRNFQGQVDRTEALIMMMSPPSKASASDQHEWLCGGHDPLSGPISKFVPPNIEAQYYCDQAPSSTRNVGPVDPSVESPEDCFLKCKEDNACKAAVWSVTPAGCSMLDDSTVTLRSQVGTVFIRYVEHQFPGVDQGQPEEAGPPNPIYTYGPSGQA
ncbi:hypothetical protein NLU13_9093 [Sarocladium strictum]|uniref:Apple domain-containing protein n=1 Tax=Sarocladium strictum TaxID=5046 RepID=A0AA39L414_SARSR|nr:hypothetical protein NLU13_9093 [Sarocladium strictum]